MIGRKKSNKGLIIIIVIVLIIIGVVCYFVLNKKEEPVPVKPKEDKIVDTFKIEYENNNGFNNKIEICQGEDAVTFYKLENDDVCNRLKITIKTESDNTKFIMKKENFYVYSDNDIIKIYDRNKNSSINTNLSILEYDVNDVAIYLEEIKGLVLEHKVDNNNYYEFYSIRQSKVIYEKKYLEQIKYLNNNYLNVPIIENKIQTKIIILDTDKEGTLLEENVNNKNNTDRTYYENIGKNYIGLNFRRSNVEHKVVYNLNLKEIDRDYNKYTETTSGKLMVSKDNIVYIYDNEGKVEKRIDNYPVILDINGDYILVLQSENVYLLDTNNRIIELYIKLRDKNNFYEMVRIDSKFYIIIINDYMVVDSVWEYCENNMADCPVKEKKELNNCTLATKYSYDTRNNQIESNPYAICNK